MATRRSKKVEQKTSSPISTPAVEKTNKLLSFQASAGAVIAIRLNIKNLNLTPIFVRISIDDWVSNQGEILSTFSRVEPSYAYILQGGEGFITITLQTPANLREKQIIRSAIRFPGADRDYLFIEATISSGKKEKNDDALIEQHVSITLPLNDLPAKGFSENPGSVSESVFSLVTGMATLSSIPSQWLFAELVVLICAEGEEQARAKQGQDRLAKIRQTRYYKNLVLAMAASRFPQWVTSSILSASSLHAALGGQIGQGRIIYIWQKWLIGLMRTDIEDSSGAAGFPIQIAPHQYEESLARYGNESSIWADFLTLGLSGISAPINLMIDNLIQNLPDQPQKPKKSRKKGDKDDNIDDIIDEGNSLNR